MKFSYLIYVVADSVGNKCAVTADESGDPVIISGLNTADGKRSQFEAEAYHLDQWCKDQRLNLVIIEKEEDV